MTQWTNIRIKKRTHEKLDILNTGMDADNMDVVVTELLEHYEEQLDVDLDEVLNEIEQNQRSLDDFYSR